MQLVLKAPAKINIGLVVKDKRIDGYHNIETIMVPIKLFDTLLLKRIDKGIRFSTSSTKVSRDMDNLVGKAARIFYDKAHIKQGIEIRLIKKIPVGAGLGGGSSDAASVLLGLNKLYDNVLSLKQLKEIAVKIGTDVPFFLYRQPCIASGQGEILKPIKIQKLHIALYLPKFSVSTKWAYEQIDKKKNFKSRISNYEYSEIGVGLTHHRVLNTAKPKQKNRKLSSTTSEKGVGLTDRGFSFKLLKKRLINNELAGVNVLVNNTFENVVFDKHPGLLVVKHALLKQGAYLASLSGSGSVVFGIFKKTLLQRACKDFGKSVIITESL
ncbi:MAG: 4-(cytidine 5'-diphospho)-2-C-methyl-D-erythritol kinase [Candidatus Latescibacteria bacterium]|nr:4-(cytidine 5'-diphospho)-2-C-methyl-D-erythritol kinase [Candidatus Latescibacterota bacterium]